MCAIDPPHDDNRAFPCCMCHEVCNGRIHEALRIEAYSLWLSIQLPLGALDFG